MGQCFGRLMLTTIKSVKDFHLLPPCFHRLFFFQDILGAMKALGLNPGEQEVVDMTNEVALHDDDADDERNDDDDDNGEQEVVDMTNEVSLDNTSSQRKNY